MDLSRLSRTRLCEVIRDELLSFFEARGTSRPRRFWLPGVDPFEHEDPADVLSCLYWSWGGAGRRKLSQALIDLAGERAELLPVDAVDELLLTIGLTQAKDVLLPMIRVLNARLDLGSARHGAFVTGIQVARGFGPVTQGWDALEEMAGYEMFPDDLVFEVFEGRLADHRITWQASFEQLESKMVRATRLDRLPGVKARLQAVAAEMARVLSDRSVEVGLEYLLDQELAQDNLWECPHVSHPREMLTSALALETSSPFVVCATGTQRLIRRNQVFPLQKAELVVHDSSPRTPVPRLPVVVAAVRVEDELEYEV